ncbi:hypothetical protein SAY87_020388 [Trapa incisa]|uniref:Rab-GAP TBC domain-containing protein n=1 Tax=Trapa incisa TaxID=236973 RepID=A0AAN7K3W4_9MYRT|nr:hypothetical protein SAY87_020388 [Trapa incisa]
MLPSPAAIIHHLLFYGSGGGLWSETAPRSPPVAVAVTALAGLALLAAVFYSATSRGHIKSPWSRRKRKTPLSPQQWRSLFTLEGRLRDGGLNFLKKVRSGGIHPSIRAEVWPYLLGVRYNLNSSKEERDAVRTQNRKEYEKLRKQCRRLLKQYDKSCSSKQLSEKLIQDAQSPSSEEVESARESFSSGEKTPDSGFGDDTATMLLEGDNSLRSADDSTLNTESSDTDSSEDAEVIRATTPSDGREDKGSDILTKGISPSLNTGMPSANQTTEDFLTWQRIIRVDAVRANADWIPYSYQQATVSETRARHCAEAVRLRDYDHLEPHRIFHASRLVAILEAYAIYDPEIGYCQGMSDLLSPIITIITDDHEAFWCFVGFMRKARHNFRLDEVGIRRQLKIVSKIIQFKDLHLYRHLQKLQADDCFFVYRMVVVLFRRELSLEQTMNLWEVMWANQAAVRAGVGKSAWSRIRQRAPPTDDLLLYAVAASVLQRRKLIIQKYNSMEDILRECNSMAGHLDVWKLLDDAHDLVVTLNEKIESSL